ncbi:hypothetical protein PS15m_004606 [Mucor circinelloides]
MTYISSNHASTNSATGRLFGGFVQVVPGFIIYWHSTAWQGLGVIVVTVVVDGKRTPYIDLNRFNIDTMVRAACKWYRYQSVNRFARSIQSWQLTKLERSSAIGWIYC